MLSFNYVYCQHFSGGLRRLELGRPRQVVLPATLESIKNHYPVDSA